MNGRSKRSLWPGRVALFAIVAAAGSYTVVCFVAATPHLLSITPDSASYVPAVNYEDPSVFKWWTLRSPGYPLFLRAVRSLSADLYLVGIFQLAAITAATMVLALAVHKATRSVVLAASVGCLLFLNAPYMWQAMQLMSEGLYAPLVTFALAAMLLLAATRSLVAAASFGVLAAYALATRPVGYSLLALIPFFWFTRRADAWKPVLAAAVSAALVCALLAYVNFSLRGFWGFQQFTGPYLAIHSAWFMDDDTGSPAPEVTAAMLRTAAPYREGYARQKNWQERYLYSTRNLTSFLHQSSDAAGKALGYPFGWWAVDSFANEYAPIAAFMAGKTLRRHPWLFLRHVVDNYVGFWWYALLQVSPDETPWGGSSRRTYFSLYEGMTDASAGIFTTPQSPESPDPLAFRIPDRATRLAAIETMNDDRMALDYIQRVFASLRPLLAAIVFAVSLVSVAVAVGRYRTLWQTPSLFAVALASIGLHLYALNIAVGSPTIARYAHAYLSVVMLILVVGPVVLYREFAKD